jgi:VanZ like family
MVSEEPLPNNGSLFFSWNDPMSFSKHPIMKLLPALLMMTTIYLFSARHSANEHFDLLRYIVYKGGHVIGYAMLTLSLWRGFDFSSKRIWLAWLLAVLYAITDEYHQSFVPGRHPAIFDIAVYDNLGALISVWLARQTVKQKQPIHDGPVVEQVTANG